MLPSEKAKIFVMGFVAAIIVVTAVAAATSNGPGPGRYRIETFESPYAMIAVLDTHTGEVRITGIGGAGGGEQVRGIQMFEEPKQ